MSTQPSHPPEFKSFALADAALGRMLESIEHNPPPSQLLVSQLRELGKTLAQFKGYPHATSHKDLGQYSEARAFTAEGLREVEKAINYVTSNQQLQDIAKYDFTGLLVLCGDRVNDQAEISKPPKFPVTSPSHGNRMRDNNNAPTANPESLKPLKKIRGAALVIAGITSYFASQVYNDLRTLEFMKTHDDVQIALTKIMAYGSVAAAAFSVLGCYLAHRQIKKISRPGPQP